MLKVPGPFPYDRDEWWKNWEKRWEKKKLVRQYERMGYDPLTASRMASRAYYAHHPEEEPAYQVRAWEQRWKYRKVIGSLADKIALDDAAFATKLQEYIDQFLTSGSDDFFSWVKARDRAFASELFARNVYEQKTGRGVVPALRSLLDPRNRGLIPREVVSEAIRRQGAPVRVWVRFRVAKDPVVREVVGMVPPEDHLRRLGVSILDSREIPLGKDRTGVEYEAQWFLVEVSPEKLTRLAGRGRIIRSEKVGPQEPLSEPGLPPQPPTPAAGPGLAEPPPLPPTPGQATDHETLQGVIKRLLPPAERSTASRRPTEIGRYRPVALEGSATAPGGGGGGGQEASAGQQSAPWLALAGLAALAWLISR